MSKKIEIEEAQHLANDRFASIDENELATVGGAGIPWRKIWDKVSFGYFKNGGGFTAKR